MTESRNCHEVALRQLVFDSSKPSSDGHDLYRVYRGSGGHELRLTCIGRHRLPLADVRRSSC